MSKIILLIIWSLAIHHTLPAQWKGGIEQYSYTGIRLADAIVPVCHIESASSWYGELRYNYEEAQTISLFAGKKIAGGNQLQYTIIPMTGFSAGRFTGLSAAANIEVDWKQFYFSSQSQYSIATKKNTENFFFSWAELGYSITPNFFSGVTMQCTRQTGKTDVEPGILAGFSINNISFPFYALKPFRSGSYFILGINYEFTFQKKKQVTH